MAGIELVKDRGTKEEYAWEEKIGVKVIAAARERGLIIRPLGNVIVIMPPLCISDDQLNRMLGVIHECIAAVTEGQ